VPSIQTATHAQFRRLKAQVEATSPPLRGHVADWLGARAPISGNRHTGPRLRGRDRDDMRLVRPATPATGGRRR
jgi:hypothetical protein